MLPTKAAILAKATELFFEQEFRNGNMNATNPEEDELRESGFLSVAQSELMRDNARAQVARWGNDDSVLEPKKPKRLENLEELHKLSFDTTEAMCSGFYISGTTQSGK